MDEGQDRGIGANHGNERQRTGAWVMHVPWETCGSPQEVPWRVQVQRNPDAARRRKRDLVCDGEEDQDDAVQGARPELELKHPDLCLELAYADPHASHQCYRSASDCRVVYGWGRSYWPDLLSRKVRSFCDDGRLGQRSFNRFGGYRRLGRPSAGNAHGITRTHKFARSGYRRTGGGVGHDLAAPANP